MPACVCTSVSVAAPLQRRDVSPLCLVSVNVRMSSQAWSCDSSAPPTSTSFHPTSSPVAPPPFFLLQHGGFYLLPCPGVTSGIWKFHLIPGQNLSVTGGHAAGGHLAGDARVAAGVRKDIRAQASPSWPTAMVSHDGGYVLLYVACRYHVQADAITPFNVPPRSTFVHSKGSRAPRHPGVVAETA